MTLPLPDSGLPGLERLINGPLWAEWSAAGKVFGLDSLRDAVRYVRLKPGTSCRISVFGPGPSEPGEPPPGMVVHLYPDAARAEQAFEKVRSTEGAFFDPDAAAMVAPFLDDPELRGLRHMRRRFRTKRWLEHAVSGDEQLSKRSIRAELLRYKPGRRAVWRVEAATRPSRSPVRVHLRVERPEVARRSARLTEQLRRQVPDAAGWDVPHLRLLDEIHGVLVRDWAAGPVWGSLTSGAAGVRATRRVGRALARLHALESRRPHEPLELLRPDAALVAAESLCALLPFESARIRRIGREIADEVATLPFQQVCLHGDFHPGQAILSDRAVIWLDLDRMRRGPTALDFASFRVHATDAVDRRGAESALSRGYRDGGGTLPSGEEHRAATLAVRLHRANRAFRELRHDWPERMMLELARIEALLKRSGSIA